MNPQESNPKEWYRTYRADTIITGFHLTLVMEILQYQPAHVFEFGCGSGKILKMLQERTLQEDGSCVDTYGLDVSILNVMQCWSRDLRNIILGDENALNHYGNFDVVFTCSVMDHIEDIGWIVEEFKRMANKAVFLAETNSLEGKFYYRHNYEGMGFERMPGQYTSHDDGATYYIWKWERPIENPELKD